MITVTTTTTTTVTTTDEVAVQPPSLVEPSLVASAAPAAPPPQHPVLLGVAAGFELGFDTHDHCEHGDCAGAGIDLGVALRPHLYAMAMASVMDSPDHLGSSARHAETLGLRLVTGNAWTQLGVGIGTGKRAYWDGDYMYGGGVEVCALAALGLDPIVHDGYRLGVQVRASTTPDVEHTLVAGLLLGLTWY